VGVFSTNSALDEGGAIANYIYVKEDPEGYTPALEPQFVLGTVLRGS
jgi:hypothetical protein